MTAVIPHGGETEPKPVWAGQYALNGNGEMTGTHWINDAGYFVGLSALRTRIRWGWFITGPRVG
ncbi:MAG: P1 family peptidase [Paracoccaceae bacterium]